MISCSSCAIDGLEKSVSSQFVHSGTDHLVSVKGDDVLKMGFGIFAVGAMLRVNLPSQPGQGNSQKTSFGNAQLLSNLFSHVRAAASDEVYVCERILKASVIMLGCLSYNAHGWSKESERVDCGFLGGPRTDSSANCSPNGDDVQASKLPRELRELTTRSIAHYAGAIDTTFISTSV